MANAISPNAATESKEVEEREEEEPPEEDGWMEVGRRNRMVITRTVIVSLHITSSANLRGVRLLDQNSRITNNAHVWWKVQVNIKGSPAERLCRYRRLAGAPT